MLCFSEFTPIPDPSTLKDFVPDFSKFKLEDYERLQVTQAEIKESFQDGWRINYIRPATFEARLRPNGVHAWLSSISRE
jgi:hypothetical protein